MDRAKLVGLLDSTDFHKAKLALSVRILALTKHRLGISCILLEVIQFLFNATSLSNCTRSSQSNVASRCVFL